MSGVAARFPWGRYVTALVVILLVALAPLFSVLVAGGIASANGCALDEGSVHPCLVGGSDWGELLYGLGVLGWLMLASLPFGCAGLIVLALVLLVHRLTWSQAKRDSLR